MARQEQLYDAQETADNTVWGRALAQYRKKGMSEKEIDKYRQNDIARKRRKGVTAVQRMGQQVMAQEGSQE